jgi:uncharacterized membrane protein
MSDTPNATDSVLVDPVAKPWYLSKSVLAGIAGLIMAVAPKVLKLFGFDVPITEDQANEVALFIIPQAVALYGRLTAKHVLTATAGQAVALNQAATK